MAAAPTYTITTYTPALHSHLAPQLVAIHAACVETDNILMRFVPPFTPAKRAAMQDWWEARLAATTSGERTVFLALAAGGEVAGFVELVADVSETHPFRAEVELFMVSPAHRRQGLGRRLMEKLEEVARGRGWNMLRLDTDEGSEADLYVYPSLGWIRWGVLPNSGQRGDGSSVNGAYYYKDFRKHE